MLSRYIKLNEHFSVTCEPSNLLLCINNAIRVDTILWVQAFFVIISAMVEVFYSSVQVVIITCYNT
jgi:hypothetical protein